MAPPSSDQQRRERIVEHMNREHPRVLSHYLRDHAGLSARAASAPRLRDVSLDRLLIRARSGADHAVRFDPPLRSWDDVRPRVLAMDAEARRRLGGLSPVTVSRYAAPRGADWLVLGGVVFYFCCAAGLPWVVPGTAAWAALERVFPGGPGLFRELVRRIFVSVVGIHLTECVLFDWRKMRKHGVERFSRLWWLWELDCFLEGVMSFRRVNKVIAEKRAEMEARKQPVD